MTDDDNTTVPDDAPPDDDDGDTTPPPDDDDAATVTPEVVRELRAENARTRTALRDRDARIEELERQNQSETERAIADARRDTEREIRGEYDAKLRAAALRAAGAGVLHDPEDAVRYIDPGRLGPDEGRWADKAAKAVDDLLGERGYLAAKSNGEPARGLISAGGRGGPGDTKADSSEWLRKAARRR
jgi:hypothetical protein